MRAAEQKYGDDLVVLFVDQEETVPLVKQFASNYGLTSSFLMDPTGAIGAQYNLFSTPTTYFVDANGVIQNIQAGVVTPNWIDAQMRSSS